MDFIAVSWIRLYVSCGGDGHWLVQMEWRPAGWSMCLPLLISPCTIIHKVQKFTSGTGLPGWSRKKGCKTVVVVVVCHFKPCEWHNRHSNHLIAHLHHVYLGYFNTCKFIDLISETSKAQVDCLSWWKWSKSLHQVLWGNKLTIYRQFIPLQYFTVNKITWHLIFCSVRLVHMYCQSLTGKMSLALACPFLTRYLLLSLSLRGLLGMLIFILKSCSNEGELRWLLYFTKCSEVYVHIFVRLQYYFHFKSAFQWQL